MFRLNRAVNRQCFLRQRQQFVPKRLFSNINNYDSLILNAYTPKNGKPSLIASSKDISNNTRQAIEEQLGISNFKKLGDVRTIYNVGGVSRVTIVSVGEEQPKTLAEEQEAARKATALGLQALKPLGAKRVGVDVSMNVQGAAEGSVLSQFSFSKLKSPTAIEKEDNIEMGPWASVSAAGSANSSINKDWETGQIYGASQNVARMLMTAPANLMTPKLFSEEIAYLLAGLENVEVIVRDEDWVRRKNMNAFLSVARGSDEPLRLLEIHYKGGKEGDRCHGLVGKGITFDSGGISLKPSNGLALMKGDMGGAATVAGALYGISKLQLPINMIAMLPLCENMPSGKASKPGDVIKAMNGKSIEILDTDAEGRLVLADALYYLSSEYSPESMIDLATLTGAMDVALGDVYAGVFTNCDKLWNSLEKAGKQTSDPFWRMPLDDGYVEEMKDSLVADLNNLGKGRSGGACSAAAFLKEFVADVNKTAWAHIDIAGVMESSSTIGYNIKGMSGRPTRSLIEYARNLIN
ncbi:cytosol aminopeptidase family, catalytic domain-containing protein [Mycotypha africana]|uniref:cytosol aminopeptidase family, catalytic domain-containing protein n=1 Tax=Mycotypha africana TaxID=64632 RepID=UPI0023019F92|nr:cytosol aminopeptidase family, catalytic domain-containing protein [Mycotypha africana]KAI8987627.1 cytosol aminopeptidase family, catalytic domain-containing protein [Mycotypha africana]